MKTQTCDVAIIGGGPAGLQAALVLARTRKRVLVFDAPEPPRNAASHGVHNFLGLDGLLPAQIRERAWQQIAVYASAELRTERVRALQPAQHGFTLTLEGDTKVEARQVILALGLRDIYPQVPGFAECWGDSIISCPYCDGYENRDRVWGLVADSAEYLAHIPLIYKNWTEQAVIIAEAGLLDGAQRQRLARMGLSVHTGSIVEVHQVAGKVQAVTLDSGERLALGTLLWRPTEQQQPLTQQVITTFGLQLTEQGQIHTDMLYQSSTPGLWVVGDILGVGGALSAAHQGGRAALAITRSWHFPDEA